MRIIAGSIKNKLIPSIKKEKYRPTSAFLREAIFNILESLQVEMHKSIVLDAFAGTGSMAFEALSRGTQKATLLDINPKYVSLGKKFILENNLNAKYIHLDSTNLPNATQKHNLLFLDPPYKNNIFLQSLDSCFQKGWLEDNATIVAELPYTKDVLNLPQYCTVLKDKQYKSTRLMILKLNCEMLQKNSL